MRVMIAVVLSFLVCVAFANPAPMKKTPVNHIVKVYSRANFASPVIAKLKPSQRFIAFHQRNGWMKVGIEKTGQVGWVNREQYMKTLRSEVEPKIKEVFVSMTKEGKKPEKITAYENGKEVNQVKAKELYDHLQKNVLGQQRDMQRQLRDMQIQFRDMIKENKALFQTLAPLMGGDQKPEATPAQQ